MSMTEVYDRVWPEVRRRFREVNEGVGIRRLHMGPVLECLAEVASGRPFYYCHGGLQPLRDPYSPWSAFFMAARVEGSHFYAFTRVVATEPYAFLAFPSLRIRGSSRESWDRLAMMPAHSGTWGRWRGSQGVTELADPELDAILGCSGEELSRPEFNRRCVAEMFDGTSCPACPGGSSRPDPLRPRAPLCRRPRP